MLGAQVQYLSTWEETWMETWGLKKVNKLSQIWIKDKIALEINNYDFYMKKSPRRCYQIDLEKGRKEERRGIFT